VFRYENEKVEKRMRRRASDVSVAKSEYSTRANTGSTQSPRGSDVDSTRRVDEVSLSDRNLSNPRLWLKDDVTSSAVSTDDQVVSAFFDKFVMYPCNLGSSGGFLEYLPCMFEEVNVGNRIALRWAVRAAAYASLSRDQQNDAVLRISNIGSSKVSY